MFILGGLKLFKICHGNEELNLKLGSPIKSIQSLSATSCQNGCHEDDDIENMERSGLI